MFYEPARVHMRRRANLCFQRVGGRQFSHSVGIGRSNSATADRFHFLHGGVARRPMLFQVAYFPLVLLPSKITNKFPRYGLRLFYIQIDYLDSRPVQDLHSRFAVCRTQAHFRTVVWQQSKSARA